MKLSTRLVQRLGVATALLALVVALPASPSSAALVPNLRVDLKMLLIADSGNEPAINAWASTLREEGVPFDLVRLGQQALPALSDGADRAFYQGVVLSDAWQPNLSVSDRIALSAFEAKFGLREVIAYAFPNPGVGLSSPTVAGNLAGTVGQVTAAGAATFSQLVGPVPVVDDAWGYLATPLDPTWTTLVQAPTGQPLVGTFTRADGVEQLVQTIDSNSYMTHQRLLKHGLLTWVTKGVHLGHQRNYFAVHIDDVLLPNDRWSTVGKCTPDADCPTNPNGSSKFSTKPIRMTAADVTRALQWQKRTGVPLDLAFNGLGSVEAIAEHGQDPLTDALVKERSSFRWINHTYGHEYLGCVQDFSVMPWRCKINPRTGNPWWKTRRTIRNEIAMNVKFAEKHGLLINRTELVTGQHSGLAMTPQQPQDNPNFAMALNAEGVRVVASDASREPGIRFVGAALTVPRHPNNTYYNVGTFAEALDEYNWIYVAKGFGGSCVNTATTTCSTTPFTYEQMVQRETDIMLGHVVTNDPRPTYMHQGNLAEEGTAYPMLDSVVDTYKAWFKVPLVTPTMTESRDQLVRKAQWDRALDAGLITAYVQNGVVTVINRSAGPLSLALTTPVGARLAGGLFGQSYGGEQSAWTRMSRSVPLSVRLP